VTKAKEEMQLLLNAMNEPTQKSTTSSSKAANEKRGKEKDKADFRHKEVIETQRCN
jgi:hypothetical protein